MSYGSTMTAIGQDSPQSLVQRAMERLSMNLGQLEHNIQHLQRQLEPVLLPQPPETEKVRGGLVPVPVERNSQMGYSIESAADRAAELVRVVGLVAEQLTV